jgi:FixJ family two-component response regulator
MSEVETVYLVDDDASVRRALTRLLRVAGHTVQSFPTAQAFLAEAHLGHPSCLVTDLRLPGLNGLELQRELQRRGQELPLIFISGHADVPSSVRAMRDGAVDFLEKPVADHELLASIKRALALARERHLERAERELLKTRLQRLTPREREVFALVATGLLNKQVGGELGAAEKTIKVHRARVMEKMEAKTLADLVRMADRLGVSAPPN